MVDTDYRTREEMRMKVKPMPVVDKDYYTLAEWLDLTEVNPFDEEEVLFTDKEGVADAVDRGALWSVRDGETDDDGFMVERGWKYVNILTRFVYPPEK